MNGKHITHVILILSALLFVTACGGDSAPAKKTQTPLEPGDPAYQFGSPTQAATASAAPSPPPLLIAPTIISSEPNPTLWVEPQDKAAASAPAAPTPTLEAEPTRLSGSTEPSSQAQAEVSSQAQDTAQPSTIQYAVQPGDSLWGLAVQYEVSMASIQLTNGLGDSTDLLAGQTLVIPGGLQWFGESTFWLVRIIQAGETLIGLASAYDLTVDEILRVNAISDPALIHPGQQLVLPLARLLTAKAPQPTATLWQAQGEAATDTPVALASANQAALAPTEPAPAPPPAPALPSGPADWSAYILARINQVRAEHGLNTLSIAPELTAAAQAHAQDCAQRGWGSHVGSDGAVLRTRLERVGYYGSNYGENWVQALNAERAFEWWYGEIPPNDPHRRNILSTYYTEIGIGIVQMEWGYVFITDFGRR